MRLAHLYVLAIIVTSSLLTGSYGDSTIRCTTIYFLNSIAIDANSSYSGILYLETPLNFSIRGLNQTARAIISRGTKVDSDGEYFIEVVSGSPLYAFVVYEVRTCSPEFSSSLAVLKGVLSDPLAFVRYLQEPAPDAEAIPLEYLGEPPGVVEDMVRGEFKEWLKSFSWYYLIGNASRYPLLISAYAAWFIYTSGYIKYEASLLPKPLDEVVESKRGDCDDMSRLLVALLWSYGIPALIAHGFTFIPDFSMKTTLGALDYIFEGGGPHAFVLAYIPGYGWLSLDFLAGSLLTYPFVVWGITKDVEVSREDVEKVRELHNAIVGRQLMTAMMPEDPRLRDVRSLELFINSSLGLTKVSERTMMPEERATDAQTIGTLSASPTSMGALTPGASALVTIVLLAALAVAMVVALEVIVSRRSSTPA